MLSLRRFQQTLILSTLFLLPFYFIRFKYNWISLNLVEILIIALCLVWIFNKNTKYQIPDTRYNMPVVLIIIGLALSTAVSKNYYAGLGVIKGWFVLPIIFAVILFDYLKKDEKLLNKVFLVLFASGVLVAVEGIYYWLSGLLTFDGRLRIFFDSPNQLAMFLAPAFLIGLIKFGKSLALMNCPDLVGAREKPSFEKKAELWKLMGIMLGLILIFFNLYLTKSYGAWVTIGLTLIIVFWLKYRNKWSKKYLFIMIIIFIIFVSAAGFGKLESVEKLGERSSLASRVIIWQSAGMMLKNNPLFGIGPGNFQNTYLEYQKYFPPYLEWAVPQPHNLYLAFWLESGLLGLAGFVWLLILFFRDNKKVYPFTKIGGHHDALAYKTKKQTQEILYKENNFGEGARSLYGAMCLAIMLYFLIHGLVDTTYWRNDMAILFWTIIAMNVYLADRSNQPSLERSL